MGFTGSASSVGRGCVADDTFTFNGTSEIDGTVATLSDGSWTSVSVASLLTNGATPPDIYLSRPSCPTLSSCIVVGQYLNDAAAPAVLPLILSAPTSWVATGPTAVTSPLATVSCPVAGWCAAIGGGNVYELSSGSWTEASSSLDATGLLACWAENECISVATGTAAAVVSDSSGIWSALASLSPFDTVSTLACDGSGNCVAAGVSTITVDSDGGAFSDVSDADQPQNPLVTVAGSSCAPGGGCAIIGDISGAPEKPAILSGSPGGAWTDSITPVVTTGDASLLYDVSCWTGSEPTYGCNAVGTEDSGAVTAADGDAVAGALVVSLQPSLTATPGFTITPEQDSPATVGQVVTFTAGFTGADISPAANRQCQLLLADARRSFDHYLRIRPSGLERHG